MAIRIRTGYLGRVAADPADAEAGEWWYNTTENAFKFYDGTDTVILGGTYIHVESVSAEGLGRPNTNPPTVVDIDNLTLYRFTLNTDRMTWKFPIPYNYDSGPMEFAVVWTNDGGVDDNGTNVRWRLHYQVGHDGSIISGNHANSPKTVDDSYPSASGLVENHTDWMSIAAADFAGAQCIYLRLEAITPGAPALTCEPHQIGMCFRYTAKRFPA